MITSNELGFAVGWLPVNQTYAVMFSGIILGLFPTLEEALRDYDRRTNEMIAFREEHPDFTVG